LIKLALIGKGIAHSLSPKLYKEFLGPTIQYDLLDIASESALPSADELRSRGYQGINITTPWKEHYASYAITSAQAWGAVNCLKISSNEVLATNTDASALSVLMPQLQQKTQSQCWVVLGDGVMARMACKILRDLGLSHSNYSRRKGDDLTQINLPQLHSHAGTKIVINACSRSFNFTGKLDGTWVFWDFNYAHEYHSKALPMVCREYVDGLSLLETQARHAVKFWELQDKDSTSGT